MTEGKMQIPRVARNDNVRGKAALDAATTGEGRGMARRWDGGGTKAKTRSFALLGLTGGGLLGHRMNGCLLGVYGALRGDFAGVDSGLGGRDGRAFCAGMGERLSYRELIQ